MPRRYQRRSAARTLFPDDDVLDDLIDAGHSVDQVFEDLELRILGQDAGDRDHARIDVDGDVA